LTFDLLTLKVVSELRVTWATAVPILVFLGLSVLDLGLTMYASDARRTSDRPRKTKIHQAVLLTAALTRDAGAAVTVRTYWAWETTATLRLLGGARGAGAPTGGEGLGHMVSPRAQPDHKQHDV